MDGHAPPDMMHVAAIDAGSNGIRLAIGRVDESGALVETANFREAVRLGADAFGPGRFTDATIDAAVAAFERLNQRLISHHVELCRAVATSATRAAENGYELVAAVRDATGIELEIIDGLAEAQIIFEGVRAECAIDNASALLIDMGGGSVELTVVNHGQVAGSESLRLGPVRLLERLKAKQLGEIDTPKLLKAFRGSPSVLLEAELGGASPTLCIGTGGNIETLAKLRAVFLDKTKTSKLKRTDLDPIIDALLAMKMPKRVSRLGLRADRADVIVIAAMVIRMLMDDGNLRKLLVPGVSLKEGLLKQVASTLPVAAG